MGAETSKLMDSFMNAKERSIFKVRNHFMNTDDTTIFSMAEDFPEHGYITAVLIAFSNKNRITLS